MIASHSDILFESCRPFGLVLWVHALPGYCAFCFGIPWSDRTLPSVEAGMPLTLLAHNEAAETTFSSFSLSGDSAQQETSNQLS